MIASPSMYDPVENPRRRKAAARPGARAHARAAADHRAGVPRRARRGPARPRRTIDPPRAGLAPALLHELADPAAGGPLQGPGRVQRRPGGEDARSIPSCRRRPSRRSTAGWPASGPSASLVAIENKTGEVKAMVGGTDFEQPAVQPGHERPPPARLGVQAVHPGARAARTASAPRPRSPRSEGDPGAKRRREVRGRTTTRTQYAGISSLRSATARSDNSVYAELGLKVGTKRIAALAQRMGVRTTALDQPGDDAGRPQGGRDAARDGLRLLDDRQQGRARVGLAGLLPRWARWRSRRSTAAGATTTNERAAERVFPEAVGETAQQLLAGVVLGGTGRGGADRRVRRRQDRHDRELRRRLVRGLQRAS